MKKIVEALEKPGSSTNALLMYGRGLVQALECRRRLVGEAAEAFHRRRQLAQEFGEQGEVLGERSTLGGGGLVDRVARDDEVRDVFTHGGERRERFVGVDRELREHLVLAREDREHLVEFRERRVSAPDDDVQVAAAAREASSEFVDDQRQPLAFGQAADVAEQIDVDGAVGLGHRQVVLPFAFDAARDFVQLRRWRGAFDAWLRRKAVDVLLADQRLRADRAGRVDAEVLEAGVFDVQHDRRLRGGRRGDRFDDADLDAVDLDVLARDHVRGIVEDRPDLVALVGSAGRDGEQQDGQQRGDTEATGHTGRPSPAPLPLPLHPDPSLSFTTTRATPPASVESPVPTFLLELTP